MTCNFTSISTVFQSCQGLYFILRFKDKRAKQYSPGCGGRNSPRLGDSYPDKATYTQIRRHIISRLTWIHAVCKFCSSFCGFQGGGAVGVGISEYGK